VTALIACPVCFGASDAPMALATNMGVFMMLGVVVVMLASFAGFFLYLNRRARPFAAAGGPAEAGAYKASRGESNPAKAGSHERDVKFGTNPQEGTA
jgi:hypothetical protein